MMNTDTFTFAADQSATIPEPFNWSRQPSSSRVGTWTDEKKKKHWCVYISTDEESNFGSEEDTISRDAFVRSINDYTHRITAYQWKQFRRNLLYYSMLAIPIFFFSYNVLKGGH